MAVNSDKPHLWKQDIAESVDLYNDWFVLSIDDLKCEGRVYGGGLHKIEPRELGRLSVDGWTAAVSESVKAELKQLTLIPL
ncbi:MAG: hypothetical protein HYY30_10055 [Chloroflexi bacterium]|nr:hypothetical protein [Chloroflexota bacterium]